MLVGCLSDCRGKVRVVLNSCVVVDRLSYKWYERGVLWRSNEVEYAIFESCEIEVCGKR